MKANLSIVLDQEKRVRLDLLKDVELTEIDQYTVTKRDSAEIREEFQTEIEQFLNAHQSYTNTFQKEANKKGSLVIIYEDDRGSLQRMRVLYKMNQLKLDTNILLKGICDQIRNQKNPRFAIELIRHFHFFLGSPYAYQMINKIEMLSSEDERILKNQNQRLLNMIRNKLLDTSAKNFPKAYFYFRLIDAYLEKNGLMTTKKVVSTSIGKVSFVPNSKGLTESSTLKKDSPYTNAFVIPEKKEYSMEEDGQYNLFSKEELAPKSSYYKYEHFVEQELDQSKKK